MKIRYKLVLGYLLVASFTALTTYFTLDAYRSIDKDFENLMRVPVPKSKALQEMRLAGLQMLSATNQVGWTSSASSEKEQFVNEQENQFDISYRPALDKAIKEYRDLVSTTNNTELVFLNDLETKRGKLVDLCAELIQLSKIKADKATILERRADLGEIERSFLHTVDNALEYEYQQVANEKNHVEQTITASTRTTMIATFLAFVLAISAGLYISNRVAGRLTKLKKATGDIRKGELDTLLEVGSNDEIGVLALSFNEMTQDLKQFRTDLASAENFNYRVMNSMVDFVVVTDMDLNITRVNEAALKINGYTEEELIGRSVNILMAERPFSKRGVDSLRKNRFIVNLDKLNLNKDGSITPITMSLSVFTDDQGNDIGIVCVGKDTSERKRQEIEREAIAEIIESALTTPNLPELFKIAHAAITRIVFAENCFVALHNDVTDLLHFELWKDQYDPLPEPRPVSNGFSSYVLRTGKPILLTPDVIREMEEKGDLESHGTHPACWLGTPLRLKSRTIGVLAVQHYEDPNAYTERDLRLLTAVGDQLALAIERKRAELEIKANEGRLNEAQRLAHIGSWQWNVFTNEVKWSRELYNIFGLDPDTHKPSYEGYLNSTHPDDREMVQRNIQNSLGSGVFVTYETRMVRPDGAIRMIDVNGEIVLDESGEISNVVGTVQDVTERKFLEDQLTHQALHDPLTGLANRVLFRDRVKHAIERRGIRATPAAVLFLDLDNFKKINDSLGHAAGDELLVTVAQRIEACLRTSDTAARLGGDEFAILVEDISSCQGALLVAERIMDILRTPFNIDGKEIVAGVSIGIATTDNGCRDPEELLRNADVAMYKAKSEGKDRYAVFESEMHAALVKRIEMEADLRRAIEAEEFMLHYQPIVDLRSGRIMGMEALVRWQHPERGIIPPLDFIPVAEETNLIVPLGRWILMEACCQASAWQQEYDFGNQLSITVNISSKQFQEDSLTETVAAALAMSALPAHSLILEITENTMLQNTDATVKKLYELKDLGVSLAIDDFGTGYSSLSYLQRFPIDVLKIDRSFIDKINDGQEGAAVARAIIMMSDTLHLKTIAEGIETFDQTTTLQDLGCEMGQGYHFARPLTRESMNEFLHHSTFTNKARALAPGNPVGKTAAELTVV